MLARQVRTLDGNRKVMRQYGWPYPAILKVKLAFLCADRLVIYWARDLNTFDVIALEFVCYHTLKHTRDLSTCWTMLYSR